MTDDVQLAISVRTVRKFANVKMDLNVIQLVAIAVVNQDGEERSVTDVSIFLIGNRLQHSNILKISWHKLSSNNNFSDRSSAYPLFSLSEGLLWTTLFSALSLLQPKAL